VDDTATFIQHCVYDAAGIFHRAIAQSGSCLSDWAVDRKPRLRAFRFGQALGCKTDDSQKLVEYLRAVPARQLVEAVDDARKFEEVFIPQRNIFFQEGSFQAFSSTCGTLSAFLQISSHTLNDSTRHILYAINGLNANISYNIQVMKCIS
jgi:hypothetical protein